MNFNKHLNLEGQHAFLGASKFHWINYDEDKLGYSYKRALATRKGTELHDYACRSIQLGIKLPRSKKTLNMYVNDAIGYRMEPELVLYYSDNCFGTVDSISFKNNLLRIHDYKSGTTPTSMHQLEVYAALFCLEYKKSPEEIDIELRIYQLDEIVVLYPFPEDIRAIMNKIITFDGLIEKIKAEG